MPLSSVAFMNEYRRAIDIFMDFVNRFCVETKTIIVCYHTFVVDKDSVKTA